MKYLIVLVLLIGGCSNTDPKLVTASDGYRFLVKEYENLSPGVEFILLKNEDEKQTVFKQVFGKDWKKIAGFTYWNENKKTCRIVIPDPAWQYSPEIIGHEVAHCIWGKWHKGLEGKGGIIVQDWSK
jgi:hypothetical protein